MSLVWANSWCCSCNSCWLAMILFKKPAMLVSAKAYLTCFCWNQHGRFNIRTALSWDREGRSGDFLEIIYFTEHWAHLYSEKLVSIRSFFASPGHNPSLQVRLWFKLVSKTSSLCLPTQGLMTKPTCGKDVLFNWICFTYGKIKKQLYSNLLLLQ